METEVLTRDRQRLKNNKTIGSMTGRIKNTGKYLMKEAYVLARDWGKTQGLYTQEDGKT